MTTTKNISAKFKFDVKGQTFIYHGPQGKPGAVCWQDDNGDWDGRRVRNLKEAYEIAHDVRS
jgi:hypothetical protein